MRHPAVWWTAARIRALRNAREESQTEFARRLQVDDETVRRWHAGKQSPGSAAIVRRLNDLAEELPAARRDSFEAECAADEVQDVNHREKLQIIAAALAAGMSRKPLWSPARAADPIDARLIAAREGIMSALVAAYTGGDAQDLLPTAASFADGLVPLLRRAPDRDLRLRTASLLVDAHGMAGVLASNVGDPLLTHRHLALASYFAANSGDPILKARAWALEARHLHSPLIDGQGNARMAVSYLGRAKALARHADGHTRAWLLIIFVEQAADLGDLKLCHAYLEDAGRVLDTATGHYGGFFSPQALFGHMPAHLPAMHGRLAGLAGRVDEAEHAIGEGLTGAAGPRQRANMLCALATVRIENDEPEGACAALGEALDGARAHGLSGKVAQIHAVRLRMDPALDTLRCVADLDERLRVA